MKFDFSPTQDDVKQYRKLRALGMELNHKIIKTIPRKALDDIGKAIGILRKGVLVFDTEDMSSVLMDCCLYDWFENGKNVVQRYAELRPAKPWTDEYFILRAYLQAKYRLLVVRSAIAGAGLHCDDILNGEGLFLMDLALSHSAIAGLSIATRTIPVGKYWITTGAGLPINENFLPRIKKLRDWPTAPGAAALSIVRACLAAGAAESIVYAGRPNATKQRRLTQHQPRPRWF